MNFDTPPQALTICGEWNKIFGDTRHKRQAAPGLPVCPRVPCAAWGAAAVQEMYPQKVKGNYADGKNKEVKLEIVGTVES